MARRRFAILLVTLAISVTAIILTAPNVLCNSMPDGVVGSGRMISVESSADLGVYTDSACFQKVSDVAWAVQQGDQKETRTLWVRNDGWASTALNLSTTKIVDHSIGTEIDYQIVWNAEGKCLAPNEIAKAEITLTTYSYVESRYTLLNLVIKVEGTNAYNSLVLKMDMAPPIFGCAIVCAIICVSILLASGPRGLVLSISPNSDIKHHYYFMIDTLVAMGYNKTQIYAVLDAYLK